MKISSPIFTVAAICFCFVLTGCPQQISGPYKISGDTCKVEFEDLTPYDKTDQLTIILDKSKEFPWSGGEGLVFSSTKNIEYVMYEIEVDDETPRNVKVFGFKNKDFGRYRMAINDRPTGKLIDFYGRKGQKVENFDLGTFPPKNGKIKITYALVGHNRKAQGQKFGAAFDYMIITKNR